MPNAATILAFRTGELGTWREKVGGMASWARGGGGGRPPQPPRDAAPDVPGLIAFWHAAGAIIDASGAPTRFSPDDFGDLPTVWMNPGAEPRGRRGPLPFVASDSEAIARLVASELLSASPASILFVEWPEPWRWSTIKRDLMRKFARLHAIPFHVVTPSAQELADAAALQSRIGSVLAEMPLPCGVFAVTDILGAAAIGAAARGGLAVPGDIAVASVDDDPEICENCSPTLTSVRPNFHSLGFAAGRLLQRAIAAAAPIKAECEVVPPIGIVRRASTLALQRADTEAAGAMELIRREACSGLRPGDAAALFHTSRRAAELRFKAATGMTFGQAILERRLAAACDYLRSGNATIAAIADFCGWNSDLAFRKAFKAQFSIPPTRWASRARQF